MSSLAAGLGAIHGSVRVANELFRLLVGGRAQRNADAGGGVDLVAIDAERHGERVVNAVRDASSAGKVVDVREQQRELVAADACDRVFRPDAGLQQVADLDEQLVAEDVPESVIDQLEAVKVEEKHGEEKIFVALQAREA